MVGLLVGVRQEEEMKKKTQQAKRREKETDQGKDFHSSILFSLELGVSTQQSGRVSIDILKDKTKRRSPFMFDLLVAIYDHF